LEAAGSQVEVQTPRRKKRRWESMKVAAAKTVDCTTHFL
jgi:hypothetical protein